MLRMLVAAGVCLLLVLSCSRKEDGPRDVAIGERSEIAHQIRPRDGFVQRTGEFGAPDTTAVPPVFNSGWREIEYVGADSLIVSDRSDNTIKVLSTQSRREIARFGRKGRGPGEYLAVGRVRNRPGGGYGVLDSQLMRITLLDNAYQTTGTIALDRLTDDIAFVTRDTIVTASFRLENAFNPLRIVHSSGAVLSEFGSVMEPQRGIIKKVIASPFAKSDVEVYSHGWMTRICYLPQVRQVVLSQTHPYTLSWCNVDSASCARLNVPAPFSTEDNMEYKVEGESRTASILPSGKALQPMVVRDLIVVPLMSATLEENYLDCYAFSGSFVQRLRVPPLPKNTDPISACMSPEGELFLLLRDRDGITWIERFAVRLSAQ